MTSAFEHRRLPALLLAALTAGWACGSAPSRARPVLVESEDTEPPRRGLTCRVQHHYERTGEATLAPPAIDSDRDGVVVSWIGRSAGGRSIRALRLSGALEPRAEPFDYDLGEAMPIEPQVTACGGRVLIAWQQQEQEGSSIRLLAVGQGEPLIVAERGRQPAVACDERYGAVAWSARQQGIQDVMMQWIDPDLLLGPAIRVSGETDAAAHPAMACRAGRCALVWSDRREVTAEVYAALSGEGDRRWSDPVRISSHDQSEAGSGGAYQPGVGPLGDDQFLVAWHDNRTDAESEVFVATLSRGGRGGTERRLSRSPAPSTAAAITSCGSTSGLVAWRDRRRGPPVVVAAAVDGRGRRSSPALTLSGEADDASAPAVACLAQGSVVVAWTEAGERGGTLRLASLQCR